MGICIAMQPRQVDHIDPYHIIQCAARKARGVSQSHPLLQMLESECERNSMFSFSFPIIHDVEI